MKYYIVLACIYTFATATHHEVRSARSNLIGSHMDGSQLSLLRRRSDFNLPLQSRMLLYRRGGLVESHSQRQGSSEGKVTMPPRLGHKGKDPRSSGSPNVSSRVTAQGPADMHTQDNTGRQQAQAAGGHVGGMYSTDHMQSTAWGKSIGQGQPQRMAAEATGRSVVGKVVPPPGGTGSVRVYSNEGEGNVIVNHVPGNSNQQHIFSSHPSGATVKATTDHGGSVIASASNEPYRPPRFPDHTGLD